VRPSGAQPGGLSLNRRALLSLFCLGLTAVGAVVAWPRLQPAMVDAIEAGRGANPVLLLSAGVLFAAVPACCGLLWHAALTRAGGELTRTEACSRYGVGSLVNSIAPAHLGDMVRAALLLQALPSGGRIRIVRCFGRVQVVRVVGLIAFALASSLPSRFLPLVGLAAVGGLCALRASTRRFVLLSLLGPGVKVAAVALLLASVGLPTPLQSAFAVVPALELAALLPLTPGNLGLASAAAAVALHAAGSTMSEALPASIVLHAVETVAGLSFGMLSALAWASQTGGALRFDARDAAEPAAAT
jgi:uncharacterized membrane protein YbhN (UPF0104 family)